MHRLDRKEEEFEDKRAYDDFLELRETMIMNLVFKDDLAETQRRLKEYAVANGIKTETDPTSEAGAKPVRRKVTDEADPSGLIKGLKRIVIPKAKAAYDPFMGMPRHKDYYEVQENYIRRIQGKANEDMLAGGYDYGQYMDECLLRAFAGLGVFVEDEMSLKNNTAMPVLAVESTKATEDVF
jgi:CDK-activating kinase assembly factor MAT1